MSNELTAVYTVGYEHWKDSHSRIFIFRYFGDDTRDVDHAMVTTIVDHCNTNMSNLLTGPLTENSNYINRRCNIFGHEPITRLDL